MNKLIFKRHRNAYTPLTHYAVKGSFTDSSFRQISLRSLGKGFYYIELSNGYSKTYVATVKGFHAAKLKASEVF